MRYLQNRQSGAKSNSAGLIKSTLALLIWIPHLAACASVPRASLAPILADPPPAVVDALEDAANKDASAAAWVIGLDRFYQKQDLQ